MANKKGVFEEKKKEYFAADKKRKGELLDAVTEVSGLTRKGAIKRFRVLQTRGRRMEKRGRPVYYLPDVIAALHDVWKIGSEACGENLHPMVGEYIDTQIKARQWKHSDEATGKLRAMSLGSVKKLRMTRSRPYHKNDNCFVEERNGHVVRAYVGFERLDAREVVLVLNDLYDVLTTYLNHFVASRRTASKERIGARWKVTREKVAKTPYQRILGRADVSEEVKEKLRAEHATLDPKIMRDEIDRRTKKVFDVQKRCGPKKLPKTI